MLKMNQNGSNATTRAQKSAKYDHNGLKWGKRGINDLAGGML